MSEKTFKWSELIIETYTVYRKRFWTLFLIALLPAIVAYLVHPLMRVVSPRSDPVFPTAAFWRAVIVGNLLQPAAYWCISAFFFAAVASTLFGSDDEEVPVRDAFSRARRRIGPVFAVALLAVSLYAVGRWTIGFLFLLPLWPNHPRTIWPQVLYRGILLMIAGLLSRLGLAIPALACDARVSFKQALRVSLKNTEDWEPFFMLFILKSAIIGYCLYWLGNYSLDWLWQRGALDAVTYPWAAHFLNICIAAALESPLFIAFSLLYRESALPRQQYASAAAIE